MSLPKFHPKEKASSQERHGAPKIRAHCDDECVRKQKGADPYTARQDADESFCIRRHHSEPWVSHVKSTLLQT